MSHFYGQITRSARKTMPTARGHKTTGLETRARSWQGDIRVVLNHDDTDDILQNVFIKVFRGIKGFKGESKLSTWIYRIAYNESINFLKLKEKKYFYSSEIMMNTMVNNLREDPYFDGNEVELKLQAIISRLPKQQKIVFQMKYFQELKFREISEILGVTTGALKASFHLAKQKIIKELKSNQTF